MERRCTCPRWESDPDVPGGKIPAPCVCGLGEDSLPVYPWSRKLLAEITERLFGADEDREAREFYQGKRLEDEERRSLTGEEWP
jgi:hypothetical protein